MPVGNNGLLDGIRQIPARLRALDVTGGLPGAPLGFRLRGATTYGPPAKGTWKAGDEVRDRAGSLWICTYGGTPGRWSGSAPVIFPSGDQTGATDAAAIMAAYAALPATGGAVRLAAGTFYVACGTVAVTRSGVYIDGAGKWATYVYATGAGDCLSVRDPSLFSDSGAGGGVRGMTIDGSLTTGTSNGIHIGDLLQPQLDVEVVNFAFNSSSIGVKFDNIWGICEQAQGLVHARGNYTGVMFTQTPGSGNTSCYGSFERLNLSIYLDQQVATYNGIVFSAGVYLDNSILNVLGNFTTSASALTSAVFTLSGSTPSGSQDGAPGAVPTNIRNCVMNVGVECDDGLAHAPSTWVITSPAYTENLSGVMNFGAAGAFTEATGSVGFWGLTSGDASIIPQTTQPWLFLGQVNTGTYASAASLASSGTVSTASSWAIVGPAAAVTGVILQAGAWDGQLLTVLNASNYSITMAAYATSNVYPSAPEVIPAWCLRQYWWSIAEGIWCPVTQGQGSYTAYLAGNVESPTSGTSLANVTGLAATLAIGTWKVRAYLPVEAVTTAATAKFAFSFGGTAAAPTIVTWQGYGSGYEVPQASTTLTTEMTTGVTTSTTVIYYAECTATVAVTVAGTLQVQCACGTGGDAFNVLAGAFLEVTQVA